MGHYVSRKKAMDWLRLGRGQSYRLLPPCYGSLINSDEILDLLNAARRPCGDPFLYIPSDIMTADELAAIPELADADLTGRKILNWTQNRTKKVPPHFYINRHCIRYSKSHFLAWLDECAVKRKRCARTIKIGSNLLKERARLARHEAAHFVIAWAVNCPAHHVNILPALRRQCRNDPTMQMLGATSCIAGRPTPFEHILISLAGPVADNWGQDYCQILDSEKGLIDRAMKSIKESEYLHPDDGDWDNALRQLCEQGFDVTDPAQFRKGTFLFLDATRTILQLLAPQWQETTMHLINKGQIGFTGKQINGLEIRDSGEDAETLFLRWGGDWGDVPKKVQDCVSKYRFTANSIAVSTTADTAEKRDER